MGSDRRQFLVPPCLVLPFWLLFGDFLPFSFPPYSFTHRSPPATGAVTLPLTVTTNYFHAVLTCLPFFSFFFPSQYSLPAPLPTTVFFFLLRSIFLLSDIGPLSPYGSSIRHPGVNVTTPLRFPVSSHQSRFPTTFSTSFLFPWRPLRPYWRNRLNVLGPPPTALPPFPRSRRVPFLVPLEAFCPPPDPDDAPVNPASFENL